MYNQIFGFTNTISWAAAESSRAFEGSNTCRACSKGFKISNKTWIVRIKPFGF